MVLPADNSSILDGSEAWDLRKEERLSSFQGDMDHPEDEGLSLMKEEDNGQHESTSNGLAEEFEELEEVECVSSGDEGNQLEADDISDDRVSICEEDDINSIEGMSDDLESQEDVGLATVSTHVAIEGEVHVAVDRVDLDKLKPNGDHGVPTATTDTCVVTVASEETPAGTDSTDASPGIFYATSLTNHGVDENALDEQAEKAVESVEHQLATTVAETESQEALNSPIEPASTSENKILDNTVAEIKSAVRTSEKEIRPATEDVSERMPSPTRSPARACSLPIGREVAKSYSQLPTTPLLASPAPDSSPIKWAKPSWTQVKLKSTEAGAAVKQGVSLQAPITHIREYVVSDHDGTHENGAKQPTLRTTAPALRRRASLPTGSSAGIGTPIHWDKPSWTKPQLRATKAGELVKKGVSLDAPGSPLKASEPGKVLQWEKPSWVQAKLRSTDKGVVVKTKGDLQKPITKVEKDVSHSFNLEANPMVLRPTEPGCDIRLGGTLAAPITHAKKNPMADVNFEANPEFILQASEAGQAVKAGTSLAKPVTTVNASKSVARDVNPVANPAILRKTELGQLVKQVGDLQAPITHVERDSMKDINLEANPMILKPTAKGFKIRLGDNLSAPITDAPKLKNPMADINFEANPDLILHPTEQGQAVKHGTSLSKAITHVNVVKDSSRDVNAVANPALLRRTELGAIVKTKGDLQKPITHVEKDSLDDINFEANPMVLRPTPKGCLLRIGEDLARPITHINRNVMAEIDDFQQSVEQQTTESED